MKDYLKRWWDGKYVPPQNDPGSSVIFVQGSYRRHCTSKLAHVIAEFYLKHWQWCFSAAFAVAGLVIAALKLP
ncbi:MULTISPECIES: hypothetical protein [unclassified Bradyrhizobium]|uniref:hypothetical protein n=1 Tax=unclassified Bradyrhizobium TaxID=2631580 RepID=UPI001CD590F0|nr:MULTISPECIES: hypothetical protein [unclassified Bradyrhizobium]MCA1428877.1 hypothetical protein [Bradyrhizobium sp. NBAIM16]MCA1503749.1 hypothetical protein [Bradyrhizobium sp. NBAIM02]MCA1514590.1 hypothetical protein [Bradyrhizobium sp. NBAIM01]